MEVIGVLLASLALVVGVVVVLVALVFVRFYALGHNKTVKKSCLYIGRVKHTRTKGAAVPKGGAVHHMDYPIFFSYVDLLEMSNVGWSLWPIFKINAGSFSLSSLEYGQHLKGWRDESPVPLRDRLETFIAEKSGGKVSTGSSDVSLLTHLTYFGYCFNPVSFYYVLAQGAKKEKAGIDFMVAEVANTPWNEQHSYLLHEDVTDVGVERSDGAFAATWFKNFHVSPFMEMDYKYHFTWSVPAENMKVTARMCKIGTGETWFTASFSVDRIEFTPINLLYVLLWYPLHTRIIQLWIHVEAVKLYFKGVPTFEHPQGTDVNFGMGITGKRLIAVYESIMGIPSSIISALSSTKKNK
ncbi:hypothetical protein B484DRAFT_478585 [Ochromonadaceae sp. CCMP2298]|nr:hypothetical protein B484DRAFT_478585 [Ochromonadaceae sp. CCMP2298]